MRATDWRKVGRLAGAVHRELQEMGLRWPRGDTILVEDEQICLRYTCPSDVKKVLKKCGKISYGLKSKERNRLFGAGRRHQVRTSQSVHQKKMHTCVGDEAEVSRSVLAH